ncbi:glucose dehydrogenase [FAD, quinone]-like [Scylla paramamosain]|uniref:glucose dehydrogenase [FAD, quinone]-like n=1 Tax=Scylla paramamosain TaxID=85552 RepID=UPI00308344BB
MAAEGTSVAVVGYFKWTFAILLYVITFIPSNYIYDEAKVVTVQRLLPTYDYLVVGGGSAGSVVAARLSEEANVTVALLEAGGHETQLSQVPGLAMDLQLSEMDWQYRAHPSTTSCLGMKDNRCNLPRGRVVGGSSSINYMLYVRGNKLDYDHWEALGNPGWGFLDVLPFFRKSEGNMDFATDPNFHGTKGLLTVEAAPWTTRLAHTFLQAGLELGYPVLDVNAASQEGFMVPHGFLRRGGRCSNAKAFLRPASRRRNLHVALNTLVKKVVINPSTRRALGVEIDGGEIVAARREVVLCAGAINTPQLLMLSGIGPAAHLRSLNITVVKDLPVGRNLQDHVAAGVTFTIQEPASLSTARLQNAPAFLRYAFLGSGPLASLGGVEGVAFVSTTYANTSVNWPDVQFHFIAGSHASDEGRHMRYILGLREDHWTSYYKPLTSRDHFTIMVLPARPRSRGFVELVSRDPRQHPKVVTNYLTEEHDVKVLLDGMRIARELGNTQAFKRLGSKLYEGAVPGCEHLPPSSPAAWECLARHLTLVFYHLCGTARMGPPGHPDTVVDPSLRVVDVSGLRVVDAAVFPTLPSANTNAAVTMVAERAAYLIQHEWQDVQQASVLTPLSSSVTSGQRGGTVGVKEEHYDEL